MTPQAQRIAIAEFIGFDWFPYGKTSVCIRYPENGFVPSGLSATAAQRAEALLRSIGKWTDPELAAVMKLGGTGEKP